MEELIPSLNGAATQEEIGAPVTTEEIVETIAAAPVETVAVTEEPAAEVAEAPIEEVLAKTEEPAEVTAVEEKAEVHAEEVKPEPVAETVAVAEDAPSEVIFHDLTGDELVASPELSLVDQFKAQAEIADSADPELDITDFTIKERILDHLEFQDKELWTNISPLLNIMAEKESVANIKKAVSELVDEKKIKYHANAHEMWGSPSGSDAEQKTTYHSIENLNLYVKLA